MTDIVRTRKPVSVVAAAVLMCAISLAGCSDAGPADLQSLGLAVSADVQAGESFELTAARDPDVSITSVSTPSGVTATVTEPDDQTIKLAVEVDPATPAGSYTLLLRTDRNGNGAELEWPFEVVDTSSDPLSEEAAIAEAVRDQFIAALAGRDAIALQGIWPASSWETIGAVVLNWFVPAEPDVLCRPFEEGRTSCFVFEQDDPWVLGLTMEHSEPDGWIITAVSLDSTD